MERLRRLLRILGRPSRRSPRRAARIPRCRAARIGKTPRLLVSSGTDARRIGRLTASDCTVSRSAHTARRCCSHSSSRALEHRYSCRKSQDFTPRHRRIIAFHGRRRARPDRRHAGGRHRQGQDRREGSRRRAAIPGDRSSRAEMHDILRDTFPRRRISDYATGLCIASGNAVDELELLDFLADGRFR